MKPCFQFLHQPAARSGTPRPAGRVASAGPSFPKNRPAGSSCAANAAPGRSGAARRLVCTRLLLLALGSGPAVAYAQVVPKPDRPAPVPDQEATLPQLLESSRPGSQHALLGSLAGTWQFQDVTRPFVKGTLRRAALYEGRFYQVEITGGKLQIPVANGQLKEAAYQSLQLEGYDNGRQVFVTASLNNHIGSDIEQQLGTYDAASHTLTYVWESELVRGMKRRDKRVLHILDATHYTEAYYETRAGQEVQIMELTYVKSSN